MLEKNGGEKRIKRRLKEMTKGDRKRDREKEGGRGAERR